MGFMDASWDPTQYLKFADARLQPALDLLGRIELENPRQIYDLGCGAGNVTRLLHERWPGAAVTGVDGSATMLAQAVRLPAPVVWIQADLAGWIAPVAADLIFSNAALHWLPRHEELLPRLVGWLAPGGILAVQMPRNFAAPSHTLIEDTVKAGPWRPRLEPMLRPVPVGSPRHYYELLAPLVKHLTLWETEYLLALSGPDPVKEWVKGTWLRPLLDALAPPDRVAFETEYARRVRLAYPTTGGGTTLFPFKRLFMIARRT